MVHMYALKLVVGQNERRQNRMQNQDKPDENNQELQQGHLASVQGTRKNDRAEIWRLQTVCYYQRLRKCKIFTAKLGGVVLLEYVVLLE